MARVISIANQKGGIGKSSSVIEIASVFSIEYNKKVLIIDLDQQRNLSKYIGADIETDKKGHNLIPSIYDVLTSDAFTIDSIQHLSHFDAISASEQLSKADCTFMDSDEELSYTGYCSFKNSVMNLSPGLTGKTDINYPFMLLHLFHH